MLRKTRQYCFSAREEEAKLTTLNWAEGNKFMSRNVGEAGSLFTILKCLTSSQNYCIFRWRFFLQKELAVSALLRQIFLMNCLTNIKFSLRDIYQMESLFIFALIMTEGNGHGWEGIKSQFTAMKLQLYHRYDRCVHLSFYQTKEEKTF